MKPTTKISPSDISQITGSTIGKEVSKRIQHVMDYTFKTPPYMYFVTKRQLIWGVRSFGDLDKDNPLSIPLFSTWNKQKRKINKGHSPMRVIWENLQEDQTMDYGWCMPAYPYGIWNILQDCFRKEEDKLIKLNDKTLLLSPSRGYFDPKTGKLYDPANVNEAPYAANTIVGYLIHRIDLETKDVRDKYTQDEAEQWFQYQVAYVQETAFGLREGRKQAAISSKIKTSARLERLEALKEIQIGISIPDWKALQAPDNDKGYTDLIGD